ncbi:MAG: hypothetical protein K9L02_08385 [Acholeplasmataceae bacterium]|nr:hypothetical protein [Acholeplasmataceae bacterium]
MKKKIIALAGFIVVLILFAIFPVSILANPLITPGEYLDSIPYIEVGNIIIITPSSTFLVYLLGVITIIFGVKLFKKTHNQTKYLWGLSLILWGIGTLLAGTSYQGLGYELKCEGQAYCLFTSWFELAYLFITAISITVMAYAVSVKALHGDDKKFYRNLSVIGLLTYSATLLLGVAAEIYFLITYEYFLIFFVLYFISFFVLNIKRYKRHANDLDKGLIIVWLMMLAINVVYFIYFYSGIPEGLYENYQIWFSANDILHVGLIGWMIYIYYVIEKVEIKG